MRGSRPAGFGGVGERAARSHRSLGSVGLAAVAARVAPLVLLPARVLSSAISSTMCKLLYCITTDRERAGDTATALARSWRAATACLLPSHSHTRRPAAFLPSYLLRSLPYLSIYPPQGRTGHFLCRQRELPAACGSIDPV